MNLAVVKECLLKNQRRETVRPQLFYV